MDNNNRSNKMLIDATHPEETRVVVLRNGRVEEFDFESASRRPLRGNIYLAKVTRVEPSLQAAFVEYGGNRHGFLAFAEIHPDYYQIPKADRDALLEEEAAAELEADQEADERAERMAHRGSSNGSSAPRGSGDQPDMDGRQEMPAAELVPTADAENGNVLADATGLSSETLSEPPSTTTAEDAEHRNEFAETSSADVSRHDEPAHAAETGETESNDNDSADDGNIEEVPANNEEPETFDGSGEQPIIADGSDEMQERPRRPRRRPYKIQEVIKRRQIMLIQVVKEERGTKGAALTTYLSLAGRYTVLMPNTGRGGGISRKITQPQDRKRLKAIAEDLDVPEGMGLIIRTAGASRALQEIRRDYDYLMRMWDSVRELTLASTAPSLVYEEGSLIKRSIRDQYTKDVDEIVVAGDDAHREAQDFMRMLMPSHAKNVILHDRPEPLFARYPVVDRQLNALFSPHVPLKSGGYLVINQTEALVAIDINSGKSTREFSIEDTALNTNLEASDEIARQVKLRDLAGLIVIDFIDMEEKRNNRAVERRIKDALRFDRARIQVGRISHFGLLEMSRQRMRTGVLEGSTSKCPHCEGTGIVRSVESVALAVLRGLEEHLQRDNRSSVNVHASAEVALYILNHKRAFIADLERRYGVFVAVLANERHQGANFHIERSAAPLQPRREPQRAAVSMSTAFAGEPLADDYDDDGDDPRPASPVIESDIESIDDGETVDEQPRREQRGRPRDRDNRERSSDRDASRDRDQPRERDRGPRSEEAPSEENREARGGEEDGNGRRRRRRGRGRGRDRDGQWQDRDRQVPRLDAAGEQPSVEAAMPQVRSDDADSFETFDDGAPMEAAAPSPNLLQNDDAPELINGDGIEGAERPASEDAAAQDGEGADGRRRRRRGRRGGRRGRERDDATEGMEGSEDVAAATSSDDAPAVTGTTEAADVHDVAVAAVSDDAAVVAPEGATIEAPVERAPVARTRAPRTAPAAKSAPVPEAEPAPEVKSAPQPEPESHPVAMAEIAASRPIASDVVIESDAPVRPARRGWWRTRGLS